MFCVLKLRDRLFDIFLCCGQFILGNPGLQRGRDGKGETGSGKKVRGGEGKGKGNGKPWEASLYRSFLDQLLF